VTNHTHHIIEVDDDVGIISSVHIKAYDRNIDNIANDLFSPDYLDTYGCHHDYAFADAINHCDEVSMMKFSIVSISINNNKCNLFSDPVEGTLSDFRDLQFNNLGEDVMNKIESQVYATQVSKPKGIDKKLLSKLWVVNEDLDQYPIV
jgi:hypothetical protein